MDADAWVARARSEVPGDDTDPLVQNERWATLAPQLAADKPPFDVQWDAYQILFAKRPVDAGPPVAWAPSEHQWRTSNLGAIARKLKRPDVKQLQKFARKPDAFWGYMTERLDIQFHTEPDRVLDEPVDPKNPQWFPGGTINIAESCFQAGLDHPAIIEAEEGTSALRTVTYRDLRLLATRFANGLKERGLGEGDGVALYMPMNTECVAAYLGTILAGCHVVSIPDSFAAPEIATRLRLGSAKLAVTMHAFLRGGKTVELYPKIREAAGNESLPAVVMGAGELAEGDVSWDAFLSDSTRIKVHYGAPDRVANVLFSSGTTGEPKAIPWTHLTPIKAASDGHLHQDIQARDVVAWPTNIGWMMGPWLIFATLLNRATMFLHQGVPTGPHFIEALNDANVTVMGVVPAIVRSWKASGVMPGSLPKVRIMSSTGEASNAHDYLYLMSLANYRAPVIEYCGGTEVGGGHIAGSILHAASPGTFTMAAMGLDFVVLKDDATNAEPGEMGEIFLLPPSIGLSQTLLNKDHEAEYYEGVPEGPNGRQLRRHGDEIQVLHGGFWAPQGRADDTMNIGGIKVGSIELETAMNTHPGVLETAAVAVRPAAGGADQLVVFAVTKEEKEGLKGALQAIIKERLNPLFRIHDVVVVDALPRTASNKVMRRELRAQYSTA